MRERGHPDAEQDIAKAKQKPDGFEPKDAIKPSDRKSSDSSLAKKEENTRFVDRTKELQRGGKIEVPGSDGVECAMKDEALQKHLDKQPKRAEMEKATAARSMPERYDDGKMKASTAQRKVEERPRQMSRDQTLEQSGFKKSEVPNEEDRSALVGKGSGAISKPLGRFQNKQRENRSSEVSVGLKRDEDRVSGKGSTNESVRGRCNDMQSNRGSKNSGEQGEKVGQEVQATDKAEQRKNAKRFAPRRHEDVVAIPSEEKSKGGVGRRNLGSQVFIANTAENGEEKITARSSKLGGEREASKLTGKVVHGESVARVERGSRDLRQRERGSMMR